MVRDNITCSGICRQLRYEQCVEIPVFLFRFSFNSAGKGTNHFKMSTDNKQKERFTKSLLNKLKGGFLGIISDNKITLTNLVVSVAIVMLELLLNSEVFDCPLKNHTRYGVMFLAAPPCIIFVANLLIVGRIWKLSNRCCVKEYRRKGECCFFNLPNVMKALVGALVWLVVAFADTSYFVCAVVGRDINKRNLTDGDEIKSLQYKFSHAKSLSHVLAWAVFLIMVVLCATVVIINRCYLKTNVLAAGMYVGN